MPKITKEFDQMKYQNEYNKKNYDRIEIKVPKGRKAVIVAAATAAGDVYKRQIQYSAQGAVTIMAGCVIAVGENAVFKTAETVLTLSLIHI